MKWVGLQTGLGVEFHQEGSPINWATPSSFIFSIIIPWQADTKALLNFIFYEADMSQSVQSLLHNKQKYVYLRSGYYLLL